MENENRATSKESNGLIERGLAGSLSNAPRQNRRSSGDMTNHDVIANRNSLKNNQTQGMVL